MANETLFIICGHGDGDCGAVGNGYQEAERVRVLASKIKNLGGNNVIVGDTSKNWYKDKLVSTYTFPKNCVILELHMDCDDNKSARGGHVVIKQGYSADKYDKLLAELMKKYFPGRANTIVGRSNLANVNRAATKGYNYRLLECGFISNAGDVNTFNAKMDDIAKGILSCFDIETSTSKVGWIKDNVGWWYRNEDGTYPKSQWLELDTWYYFDAKGYAICNDWKQISYKGKLEWFYFDENCKMVTGWKQIKYNNKLEWFYLDLTDGHMYASQWIKSNGKDYYLDKSGVMATSCYIKSTSQNIYYWVNAEGIYEPQWDTATPNLTKYKLVV